MTARRRLLIATGNPHSLPVVDEMEYTTMPAVTASSATAG